jgi:DnaJ-class molecular chaperone
MTKQEIIIAKNIELECMPYGKVFTTILGKDVKGLGYKSVLMYGSNSWVASKQHNASFDLLFFYLVKKGKIEVPSDYQTCDKCGGTGNVGYIQDGGICYKCQGWGYKFIK